MNRATRIGIGLAYLSLCFIYSMTITHYLWVAMYNNGVVHSNSTCDNCVTIGYYASLRDGVGNCNLQSADNCSRGIYLNHIGTFKCGDEVKYKSLADRSKIGQPTERCSFDSETHVYQSVEGYYARILAYSRMPWFEYIAISAMGLGLGLAPLLTKKYFANSED